jgi:DNA-binding GntR family transcriptional regulator
VWIAANELPLREELIPFLIARSGRPLDDFARWVAARRPPAWVLRMVQIVPMSPGLREEMLRYVPQTDDPEVRARQRQVAKILLDLNPDLRKEIVEEGLGLVYEQRLGRPLTDAEHRTLFERLTTLGSARLGSVVLSLTPEALAAWLADPAAT